MQRTTQPRAEGRSPSAARPTVVKVSPANPQPSPAEPVPPGAAAPASGPQTTDVVVIGGGLIGCAAAYYLAKAGVRATLVEKGAINRQASGQNAGSLHFQMEHREVAYGDELSQRAGAQIPLKLAAIRLWSELEDDLQADLEVVQHGGMTVAETDEEVEALRRKQRLERQSGLVTELLTGPEARRLCPALSDKVKAVAFCPDEGHANPRLVTPAYARRAAELGARIITGASVVALARRRDDWVVTLSSGERFRCRAVVNAAGAWAGQVTELVHYHLPVVPLALHMNVTVKTGLMFPYLIQHVSRKLSLKQVRDGNVLIGGGWPSRFQVAHGRRRTDLPPLVRPETIRDNLAAACAVAPGLRELPLLRTWTGVVGVTVDGNPVVGELESRPGFFVAAGGSGFTLGPVYASLLAELITTGRTSLDISAFRPSRFDYINLT